MALKWVEFAHSDSKSKMCVSKEHTSDFEACKRVSEANNYAGFVHRKGEVFYRDVPAAELVSTKEQSHGATLFCRVPEELAKSLGMGISASSSSAYPSPRKGSIGSPGSAGSTLSMRAAYVPARLLRRQGTNDSFGETNARPVCRYGSTCFRRNPQHSQEESHPADEDYLQSCKACGATPEFVSKHKLFRWCNWDSENSEKASRLELTKVWSLVQSLGEDLGEIDDALWKELDEDGNGFVNFSEFAEFTTRHGVDMPLGLDNLLGKRHGSVDMSLRCGVKDCDCMDFQEKRRKCKYGEGCFQTKDVHKQQFCHPCDPDWKLGGASKRDEEMCRCGHKKRMHASAMQLAGAVQYPSYWESVATGDQDFNKLVGVDTAMLEKLQQLVNLTYSDVTTRDRLRHNGSWEVPRDFEVVSAIRNENSKLWRKYLFKKADLQREKELIEEGGEAADDLRLDELPEYSIYTDIRTSVAWKDCGAEPLADEVNEWYLWHGTSTTAAASICQHDFKIDVAGAATGTLYGKGTYLAESITKADEYAGMEGETHCVLLCRVLGGRVRYCDVKNPDPDELTNDCLEGAFDCVLGDRAKANGTYREFIVFDTENVYPEYIVTYKRGALFKSKSHPPAPPK